MAHILKIAPGIYQLSALGAGVFALIEGGQVVMIDAGLRITPRVVADFLDDNHLNNEDISHILITHHHPDHVSGLARLQTVTRALVGAHVEDAPYIMGQKKAPNPAQNAVVKGIFTPFTPLFRARPAPVDLLFQDGALIDFMGGVEVVHTPGHTGGSLSYFLPQKGIVFVGDAMQRSWGKLSTPSGMFTESMEQAKASMIRLSRLDFDTLCLSHFPPTRKRAKKELLHLLETMEDPKPSPWPLRKRKVAG